jgi:predicted GTPase
MSDDFQQTVTVVCSHLARQLDTVKTICQQPETVRLLDKDRTTADNLRQTHGRLELKIRRIEASRGDALHMVFLGNYDAGKSTLINALGRAANNAPDRRTFGRRTDYLPTDDCITFLQYGDTEQTFPQRITDQDSVVVQTFPFEFLRHIVMVDTPGVGDEPRHDRLIYDYLDDVDLLILVTPATQPLNDRDQELLLKKFDRFRNANGIIVVTKMGLVCHKDKRIDHIDEDKAATFTERLRSHLRTRFPDHGARLLLQAPDARTLWVVDSECDYHTKELADYLFFQKFGQAEESKTRRREMVRSRLRLYAGDIAGELAVPLGAVFAGAVERLNQVIARLESAGRQTLTGARSRGDLLASQLRRLHDQLRGEPGRLLGDFGSEFKPGLVSPHHQKSLETFLEQQAGRCKPILDNAKQRYFLSANDHLGAIVKDGDLLLANWVEEQCNAHLRFLRHGYASRVEELDSRNRKLGLAGILETLTPAQAGDEPLPSAQNKEDISRLEKALDAAPLLAEVRRGAAGFHQALRQALLTIPTEGGPVDFGRRMAEFTEGWRKGVARRIGEVGDGLARPGQEAPAEKVGRFLGDARGQVIENLKEFAEDYARNIYREFEACQHLVEALGFEQKLADLTPVTPREFTAELEGKFDAAGKEHLAAFTAQAAPLLARLRDDLTQAVAQAEQLGTRVAGSLAARADECFREDLCQAEYEAAAAGTDWHRAANVNLHHIALAHQRGLEESIEAQVKEVQANLAAHDQKVRWSWLKTAGWIVVAPLVLFVIVAMWEVSTDIFSHLHGGFMARLGDMSWQLAAAFVIYVIGACWFRINRLQRMRTNLQEDLKHKAEGHLRDLKKKVLDSRTNLHNNVAVQLAGLVRLLEELITMVQGKAKERLAAFQAEAQRLAAGWPAEAKALGEETAAKLAEYRNNLAALAGTQFDGFQEKIRQQFQTTANGFLERHLGARTDRLGSLRNLFTDHRTQLERIAGSLKEPPRDSPLARL